MVRSAAARVRDGRRVDRDREADPAAMQRARRVRAAARARLAGIVCLRPPRFQEPVMTARDEAFAVRLEDPDWYLGDPHATYRRLRREAPVFRVEPHGFWLLTKHADVHAVSKDPGRYCSSHGFRINEA